MKTRGIIEVAMFCVLAVMLALASFYIPLFTILVFFIPVPMVILGKRQGLKVSIISSLAVTILIGLFWGPINAIPFTALMLLVGCSLGFAYHKNLSPVRKVVIGTVGFSILLIVVIASYELVMGVSFTAVLFQTLEASTKEVMTMYETTNVMDSTQLETAKESMAANIQMMKMALPGAFILFPVMFAMVDVIACDFILKRIGYQVNCFKPLAQWQMPTSLKYFLMIFLIGDFIISVFQITAIPEVYTYTLISIVNVIFFLMGLAFIFDYMDYKKINNKGIKVLVVFVGLLLTSIVTLLGVADTYIGIRRIFRRETQIK